MSLGNETDADEADEAVDDDAEEFDDIIGTGRILAGSDGSKRRG